MSYQKHSPGSGSYKYPYFPTNVFLVSIVFPHLIQNLCGVWLKVRKLTFCFFQVGRVGECWKETHLKRKEVMRCERAQRQGV